MLMRDAYMQAENRVLDARTANTAAAAANQLTASYCDALSVMTPRCLAMAWPSISQLACKQPELQDLRSGPGSGRWTRSMLVVGLLIKLLMDYAAAPR